MNILSIMVYIFFGIVFIVAVVLLIRAIKDTKRKFNECIIPIEATVINIKKRIHSETSRERGSGLGTFGNHSTESTTWYVYYTPFVVYVYNGQKYSVYVGIENIYPNRFKQGDKVILRINPNNPAEHLYFDSDNIVYQESYEDKVERLKLYNTTMDEYMRPKRLATFYIILSIFLIFLISFFIVLYNPKAIDYVNIIIWHIKYYIEWFFNLLK